MEAAAGAVAEPILDKTAGCTFAITGRQIGYIRRYIENIENLGRRLTELGIVRGNVQTEIDRATNNGHIVREYVSDWLKKAEEIEQDTKGFLSGEVKSNNSIRCLKGLFPFPNIKSRYRLGKEAVKRTEVVAAHEKLGEKFDGAVISDPPPPPDLMYMHGPSDYQVFESRRSVCEAIMKALKDETIHRIGIWGMGGVGKTTMAAEVGDKAKKYLHFDKVVMAVVSQDPKVTDIKKKLADQLEMKMKDNETEFNITSRLCSRLKWGKNLVILDDVWEKLNLNSIGIPSPDEASACKVLLTTREKSVIQQAEKWIPIEVLCKEEAWNLFEKKVGDAVGSNDAMLDLAKKVCGECGGLPVAILAIAGALKDQSKDNWEYLLSRLQKAKFKDIGKGYRQVRVCLQFSYDHLETEEAKSCFLFCSLFPEDFDIPIDSLMRFGRGTRMVGDMTETLRSTRGGIGVLVNDLKNRCLLLEGKDSKHVKMHDVVRDVAISIASEGHEFLIGENLQQWPERKTYDFYSVISLTFDADFDGLPDDFEYPKIHTILLKCKLKTKMSSSSSPPPPTISIPDTFFDKMTKLQVISLEVMKISSLPSSMKFLDEVRVLCLLDCDLGDISSVGELKKLEMLILKGSKIHVLPRGVGDLTSLKLLDLRNCDFLDIISPTVLSGLSKLQELFMPTKFKSWGHGSINTEERSADLAELEALNKLESLEIHVPNFEMLPQQSFFPFWGKLKIFKISVHTFLNFEEHEQSKNVMTLEGVPLERGLDLLLKEVEAFNMKRLEGLRDFKLQNGDKESFSKLGDLQADSCEGMQEFLATVLERPILPKPPRSKLSVLKIKSCKLRELLSPSAAEALGLLRRLEIGDCKNMEAVVGRNDVAPGPRSQAKDRVDNIIFPKLVYLWLYNLPDLVSFYPKMNQTTGLVESQDFSAQPLFNDTVSFPELEELRIWNAGGCKEMVLDLPAEESFSKLRVLTVSGLNCLLNFGPSTLIPRLQSLQRLHFFQCASMRAVFKAKSGSEIRERGEIVAIDNEKAVALEVSQLPALRSLKITFCRVLEEFCWDSCPRSKEATNAARPFFSDRVAFPELEEVYIDGAGECEEIVGYHLPAQESFSKLRELRVERMKRLSNIGPSTSIPRLQNLQKLLLICCDSLRAVFKAGRREISEREEIVVIDNENATAVDVFQFQALQSLEIEDCRLLKEFCWDCCPPSKEGLGKATDTGRPFFSDRVAFPELEKLVIHKAGECREIGLHLPPASFSKLRVLTVEGMEGISTIGTSFLIQRLQSLQELDLGECGSLKAVFKVGRSEVSEREEIKAIPVEAFELPALRSLSIRSCSLLEEFCWDKCLGSKGGSDEASPFFSDRVAFPELEKLKIEEAGGWKEIGLHLPPQESFCKLKKVRVGGMKGLSNIGSSTLIPRLQNLQKLHLSNCGSLKAVFKAGRSEVSDEGEEIVAIDNESAIPAEVFQLPALHSLTIKSCGLLKGQEPDRDPLLDGFYRHKKNLKLDMRRSLKSYKNRLLPIGSST